MDGWLTLALADSYLLVSWWWDVCAVDVVLHSPSRILYFLLVCVYSFVISSHHITQQYNLLGFSSSSAAADDADDDCLTEYNFVE